MNDFENLIADRLYLADFEVAKFDWLFVVHKYSDNSETIFHNATGDEVYNFISEKRPIFLFHNGKHYDQYILKAILSGFDMSEIKAVNDYIINGGQGFEISYEYLDIPILVWDTMQDIVPSKSLKEIEANLLMDITESTIDFNIDHKWDKREYDEMLYYCRHDVDALRPLFEARKSYFKTKYDLCILSNIDPTYNMGLTNAKLCAKFLEADLIKRTDERNYTIPSTIDLNYVPDEILTFFNRIHDDSISDEEFFTTKLNFDFHGMPSVFSLGGAHGALSNFVYDEKETPDIAVVNVDYSSLYPHLLALPEYNYISRNIKDSNKYYNTLQRRLKLKHEGRKEEQLPLKLILNTTYGCQNNKYNDLYDPWGARSTCITGQLMIASMTEEVYRIGDVKLIQINTDGLMIALPKNKLPEYYEVCNKFSERVKIGVEYDIIHKIVQRDVNNYIMIYGDDKLSIKAKGGCFGALPNLKIEKDGSVTSTYKPNFKANSLAIVSEALAKNLLFDTPIEETILNDDTIHKYQMISHLGSTYEKCVQESPNGDILLQKNNRIYAGLTPSGAIIKVKPNGRRDSLPNQPPNPIVDNKNVISIEDINKPWYIKLARQWVNDFKGVRRLTEYKKDELLELASQKGLEVDKKTKKADLIKLLEESEEKEMATKIVETNEETKGMNIYEKLNKMKEEISDIDFVLDKILPSNMGSGEYASIGQLYTALHKECIKYNVYFQWDVIEVGEPKELFKPTGKLPQHVWDGTWKATFINIDNTNEVVTITTKASGSDICDKGISSSSTMAFRNFFDKNFTPKYLNQGGEEVVSSEEEKTEQPKIPTYIPPEKKEALVEKVVSEKQVETNDDRKQNVVNKIMEVREKRGNDTWGSNTVNQILTSEISEAELLSIELKVDNKLDSLK